MDKILNNLGLAQRASALITGEEMVIAGIQAGNVCYIFLAKDAGKSTYKKITDKAKFYQIEVNESYSSDELSHAIGKNNRKVIGIVKKDFLKILKK